MWESNNKQGELQFLFWCFKMVAMQLHTELLEVSKSDIFDACFKKRYLCGRHCQ